jgi:ankyrin repeat protein
MLSDRVQRQVDRLLDEAEEAIALRQWEDLRATCEVVLNLDPDNSDAPSYIALADKSLGTDADIIDTKDAHFWTLLHVCAHDSNFISLHWLDILIDGGADIEATNSVGETPLNLAAERNSLGVARRLIDSGADIEAKNYHCQTPLYHAVTANSLEVARLLIDCRADIEAKGEDYDDSSTKGEGRTPLQCASDKKFLEVARLLIDHGASTENIDLRWMDRSLSK